MSDDRYPTVATRVLLPDGKYFDAFGPSPADWTADDMSDVFRTVMARAFGVGTHAFLFECRSSIDAGLEKATITITVSNRSVTIGPAKFSDASIQWLSNISQQSWIEESDDRGN